MNGWSSDVTAAAHKWRNSCNCWPDVSQLRICRPPPPPFRSGHLYMKDAHCAGTNEKSSFRFLVFELLVAKRDHHLAKKNRSKVAKFTGKMLIDLTMIFCIIDFFCAILSFLDMIDFALSPMICIED